MGSYNCFLGPPCSLGNQGFAPYAPKLSLLSTEAAARARPCWGPRGGVETWRAQAYGLGLVAFFELLYIYIYCVYIYMSLSTSLYVDTFIYLLYLCVYLFIYIYICCSPSPSACCSQCPLAGKHLLTLSCSWWFRNPARKPPFGWC